MHTHFRAFFKKFFEKIYLFTCSHWEVPNYRVFLKNFYSTKSPLTYLELQSQMTPCFSEKMKKYFFSYEIVCFYLPQKSLHLFGIGRSKRNLFFRKFEKFLKRLSVSKNTLYLFLLAESV